MTGE
jgi:hypothetical protein